MAEAGGISLDVVVTAEPARARQGRRRSASRATTPSRPPGPGRRRFVEQQQLWICHQSLRNQHCLRSPSDSVPYVRLAKCSAPRFPLSTRGGSRRPVRFAPPVQHCIAGGDDKIVDAPVAGHPLRQRRDVSPTRSRRQPAQFRSLKCMSISDLHFVMLQPRFKSSNMFCRAPLGPTITQRSSEPDRPIQRLTSVRPLRRRKFLEVDQQVGAHQGRRCRAPDYQSRMLRASNLVGRISTRRTTVVRRLAAFRLPRVTPNKNNTVSRYGWLVNYLMAFHATPAWR